MKLYLDRLLRHPVAIVAGVVATILVASTFLFFGRTLSHSAPSGANTRHIATLPSSTSTTPLSGWLAYQTETFCFRYPPDYEVIVDSSDTLVYAKSATSPYGDNLEFSHIITRTDEPTTYAFAHGGLPPDYNGFEYDREITINGVITYEYGLLHGTGTFAHDFFLKDQNHGIDAAYELTSPLAGSFKQIIDTFCFIGR